MKKLITVTSKLTYEQWVKFGEARVSTYTPRSDVLGLLMALPLEELKELIQRCHELDPKAGHREATVEGAPDQEPEPKIQWRDMLPQIKTLLKILKDWSLASDEGTLGIGIQQIWELLNIGPYSPRKAATLKRILTDHGWETVRVQKYVGARTTARVWVPADRDARSQAATEEEIQDLKDLLTQATK